MYNMVCNYYIVPVGSITDEMIDNVIENRDTLRKNLSGTLAIVKHSAGPTPACLQGFDKYSHSEILTHLGNVENGWTSNEELV